MWKRSYWVLMTYIKRPLFWSFAVVLIAISCGSLFLIDDKYQSFQQLAVSPSAITTFEQLNLVLATDPGKPVELDYGQLYIQATHKVFPEPRDTVLQIHQDDQMLVHAALAPVEKLKHVVAINAGYTIDQATLERIAKFTTLKRLSMITDFGYETLDLSPLRDLKELEELQFGFVARVDSLEPLFELPKLHTLGIGLGALVRAPVIEEIADLKHLRVLSLPYLISTSGLTESLQSLSKVATLERINYGVSWDHRASLNSMQVLVPGIRIAPSVYRTSRYMIFPFALILVLIGSIFLSAQVTGQFSLTAAYLAPHFRGTHYRLSAIFAFGLIALSSAFLCCVGANAMAAIPLILAYGGALLWSGTRSMPDKPNWTIIAPILLVAAIPFEIIAQLFDPMAVDNYLMSGYLTLPLVFLGVAIFCCWQTYYNLESRLRWRVERNLPALLSIRDRQVYGAAYRAKQSGDSVANPREALVKQLPLFAKAILVLAVASVVLTSFGYSSYGRAGTQFCANASAICLIFIVMKWWCEMPFFAAATIRPPVRSGHVDRLLKGVAKNFADLLPMFFSCLISVCFYNGFSVNNLGQRMMTGVIAIATITLAVYAVVLWVLAIRTILGAVVLAFIAYLIIVPMVMHVATIGRDEIYFGSLPATLVSGCVLSGVAISAIIFARRYLMRIEWARFV